MFLAVAFVTLFACCLVINSVGIGFLYSFWFDLLYGVGCLVVFALGVVV